MCQYFPLCTPSRRRFGSPPLVMGLPLSLSLSGSLSALPRIPAPLTLGLAFPSHSECLPSTQVFATRPGSLCPLPGLWHFLSASLSPSLGLCPPPSPQPLFPSLGVSSLSGSLFPPIPPPSLVSVLLSRGLISLWVSVPLSRGLVSLWVSAPSLGVSSLGVSVPLSLSGCPWLCLRPRLAALSRLCPASRSTRLGDAPPPGLAGPRAGPGSGRSG